jgi:hypothetical protein
VVKVKGFTLHHANAQRVNYLMWVNDGFVPK